METLSFTLLERANAITDQGADTSGAELKSHWKKRYHEDTGLALDAVRQGWIKRL